MGTVNKDMATCPNGTQALARNGRSWRVTGLNNGQEIIPIPKNFPGGLIHRGYEAFSARRKIYGLHVLTYKITATNATREIGDRADSGRSSILLRHCNFQSVVTQMSHCQ